jgi:1-acyl-sn-glycerol-3-phosphate acyltransferase
MPRLFPRILISIIILLGMLVPLCITSRLSPRANSACVRLAFYLGAALWGIRVRQVGRTSPALPLLVVSNHFSYLDVFALGSCMNLRFTPKSEVASWPVIGFFCKITGCVFIDRRASRTLHNKNNLEAAAEEGGVISLFPESTTHDGSGLLPFKSSFFSIAHQHNLTVQPVGIVYTRLNGAPMTPDVRPVVGWYGDAEFFPHLLNFLRQRSVDVTLVFHTPVQGKDFASRKELAKYCEEVIGKDLSQSGAVEKSVCQY